MEAGEQDGGQGTHTAVAAAHPQQDEVFSNKTGGPEAPKAMWYHTRSTGLRVKNSGSDSGEASSWLCVHGEVTCPLWASVSAPVTQGW